MHIIETKYALRDKVFVLSGNKIHHTYVNWIKIEKWIAGDVTTAQILYNTGVRNDIPEKEVYASIEDIPVN